ncbi:hypothetical protein K435DRAFT_834486 [Dendrothele bispora CBS 962.96]|uniref:DUF6535 domain-containing protein n=1 Tax=Dendrothele bispora (strain CBS 962.96) TaxID=1314807 RepID=A0A4S8MSP4_DENBC|nr:hypothetical protein K435DRAFT_834486 [Dendrothele bispora CBS 962.96]
MPDEEPAHVDYRSRLRDDPSARIWTVYLNEAEKEDRRLTEMWKGDMDSILIFAGLFSASVTAFIIESYKTLSPDNSATSVLLLARIYQRLANPNGDDSFDLQSLLDSSSFTPSTPALICNTLWFLSLGFSLVCALSAVLVQQWTRQYLQSTSSRESPFQRARISAYLFQGLERFRMQEIVTIIPILLHISLLLFFAGLVEFLRPINIALSYLVLVALLISGSLYIAITLMPLFAFDCPYRTPLTSLMWGLCRALNLFTVHGDYGLVTPIHPSFSRAREIDATTISHRRDDRDYKAMRWALDRLQEDSEFEPFVEFVPEVVAGYDYSSKLLIHRLLGDGHETSSLDELAYRLDLRINGLLASCLAIHSPRYYDTRPRHLVQDKEIISRRTETCLKAIWSLTMMSRLPISGQTPVLYLSRKEVRFDEKTLDLIQFLRRDYADEMGLMGLTISTGSSVTRSLLDMFIDQSWALENEIVEFIRRGRFSDERVSLTLTKQESTRNWSMQQLLYQLEKTSDELESVIQKVGGERLVRSTMASSAERKEDSVMSVMDPNFIHQIDGLLGYLNRLVTGMVLRAHDSEGSDQNPDATRTRTMLAGEAIAHIKKFRGIAYHAGVLLMVEFVEAIVERLRGSKDLTREPADKMQNETGLKMDSSDEDSSGCTSPFLPHEPLNTIRRLYLKLYQDSEHLHLTNSIELSTADSTNISSPTSSNPSVTTSALDTLIPISDPFRIYPEICTLVLLYLEDALDPVHQRGGRIQEVLANVLLGLLGMVVDSEDSGLSKDEISAGDQDKKQGQNLENSNMRRARRIVERYLEGFPTSETATRILCKMSGS